MDDFAIAKLCRDKMYEADPAIRVLDISVEVSGVGRAEASCEVRPDMLNGFNVCHGGYLFTLADTAFAYACNTYNKVTVAAGASIEFLQAANLGDRLVATATERRRGRTTGIYDVVVCNQDGEEVAIFRGRSHSTRNAHLPEL
jgi:acyl-CoA thioesterase